MKAAHPSKVQTTAQTEQAGELAVVHFPASTKRQLKPQPPPSSLTASSSSFAPFFSGRVHRVVLGIHNPQEARVAEALRTPAPVENPPVQKDADVVRVPDIELLHLVSIGLDGGARVEHLHARLRLQPGREVRLEGDVKVRGLPVPVECDDARGLPLRRPPSASNPGPRETAAARGCAPGRRTRVRCSSASGSRRASAASGAPRERREWGGSGSSRSRSPRSGRTAPPVPSGVLTSDLSSRGRACSCPSRTVSPEPR